MKDTIFALASGAGRGGIAVFRLSGPGSGEALKHLSGGDLPQPRYAQRVKIVWKGEAIDDGLALWFKGPASFTGEDVVELHLHGGHAVASALTEALLALGLRPAEPGEFTRRAFEAGKLDLTQAEAIADLVDADTAAQRRQALRQMDGALMRLYDDWRERILGSLAHIEAEIDFADEDLPEGLAMSARRDLADLAAAMRSHLDDGFRGERVRDGYRIALLGAVNVGKSSLLNRLAGRPAAIVSSMAGTTRDVIEIRLDIGGLPVTLADTAGLRDSADLIEEEGVKRARARAADADLRLVILDGTKPVEADSESLALLAEGRALAIVNKVDLARREDIPMRLSGVPVFAISAETGEGIDAVLAAIEKILASSAESAASPPLTRARHRKAVEEAHAALVRALDEALPELVAEDVRMASRALGRINGRIDVEDVLDAIFRDFCIGK